MSSYSSASIEVLSGLEPVKKRPGMYTDVTRPNHLVQEVVDNSVDEAIAGYATEIAITLHKDGSVTVADNGRGMPVDIHPKYKLSGVELILTKLHAGAKFSNKDYRFAGGLHGVGVSVVNALSAKLQVTIKRNGNCYYMDFAHGKKVTKLSKIGTAPKKATGTMVRFWPEKKYFDSDKIAVSKLQHLLRAKAVLCPGLLVTFNDELKKATKSWQYQDGLEQYLRENIAGSYLPEAPFAGHLAGRQEEVSWAIVWSANKQENFQESYVNLVPTIQGGTHVNGFRAGLLEAMREFCEIHNLLPRGVKLAPEDIWERANFVLSAKLQDAQFAGQTKERLASRQCAAFVAGVVKDSFSLWLNQHVQSAKVLAELVIELAKQRMQAVRQVERKKVLTVGPALPGKLADCTSSDTKITELFLVEGDSAGGSAKQARDKNFQAVMPLRGKILNSWEVTDSELLNSKEVHDIAVAIGVDPGAKSLEKLRYGKICILADADSDGRHIATLLCALFVKHFSTLVEQGHVFAAMPPLYRIDVGKQVYYALDDAEKQGVLDRIAAEYKSNVKINVQRFKGLGEMNPMQLRETTMAQETRRLVQLTVDSLDKVLTSLDMLLAKKRSSDRRTWLETKGNLAEI